MTISTSNVIKKITDNFLGWLVMKMQSYM